MSTPISDAAKKAAEIWMDSPLLPGETMQQDLARAMQLYADAESAKWRRGFELRSEMLKDAQKQIDDLSVARVRGTLPNVDLGPMKRLRAELRALGMTE